MTTTLNSSQTGLMPANKSLIADELWDRLVTRIVKDNDVDRSLAERIMDQALGFLRLVAIEPGKSYAPSRLVDIGWHTFILYTREYARFCDEIKGGFIHHEPSDGPGMDDDLRDARQTLAALRAGGFSVDEILWSETACCGDSGASCHNQ